MGAGAILRKRKDRQLAAITLRRREENPFAVGSRLYRYFEYAKRRRDKKEGPSEDYLRGYKDALLEVTGIAERCWYQLHPTTREK